MTTITHKLLPDLPPCVCGAFAQLTTEVTPGSFLVECSDYDCTRPGCTSGLFETEEAAIKTWLLFHPVKVAGAQP